MATDPRVHAVRLSEFGVPVRLRGLRQTRETSRAARAFVENFRDHFVTDKRPLAEYPSDLSQIGRGLLWAGLPGRGKTYEATSTLLEVYYQHNVRVCFIGYVDYLDARKAQWSLNSRDENSGWWDLQKRIALVHEAPLLMLDDVGKELDAAKSKFAASELDTLLRARHRNGRPTLITTNLPADKWGEAYNPSMRSFLKEAFTPIHLDGEDRRK